jgi:CRISPR-associated protein Cas2
MYILVVYDISDDKRRRLIDKLLSSYGYRVNYSVFEIEINHSKYAKLITSLTKLSDKKSDHIRIYRLNKESLAKSLVVHKDIGIFDNETLYF